MSDYTPHRTRVVFDVTPDVRQRLSNKLTWGETREIYTVFTEQLLELLESHDPELIKAGIISKQVKLTQIIDFNKKIDRNETS